MPARDQVSETFVGLRLEKWLKDGIRECAKTDHRSASNWIRIVLEEAVEKRLKKK